MSQPPSGRLFVIPTPIGNLEDITLRALRVLKESRLIATEDTRKAKILFDRYGIAAPCVSYFEGNEATRSEELLARLAEGDSVALISEAGMPGISDPGGRMIKRAIEEGIAVEVLPGASAVLTALVGSGLPTDRFLFLGFLPRVEGERQTLLAQTRGEPATLILYEAPGRAGATLADLAGILGHERRACLARELTKVHEEYVRSTLGELAARYAHEAPRGEVVIVVEGATAPVETIDLEAEVRRRLSRGETPKEIAAALALLSGAPRRKLYQLALVLSGRTDG